MPLGAADKGSGGLFGNLAFWGSGDYRSISGGSPQSVDYDGGVVSANLGVDTRIGADMLAGVSLAQTSGTVDYTASNVSGELTTNLTSINPYLGWQMPGGMNLWAMAGFGWGEVEIDDESAGTQASDLTQKMVAAGASGTLMSTDQMIAGGTTNLRLKGEVAFTSADVDGAGSLESTSLSASRQRLLLEGSHDQKLDSGATLTPSLELGLRSDGGDGETGTGIEAGGCASLRRCRVGAQRRRPDPDPAQPQRRLRGDRRERAGCASIRARPARVSRSAWSRRGARRPAACTGCGRTASPRAPRRPTRRRHA